MNTRLLSPTPDHIAQAAALLRAGQLVAFPTETVYGLGANALDPAAVAAIFAAKGRPADNPLIVHVADPQAAQALCFINDDARALMAAFCPGPLTLLLPKRDAIPAVVNAGLPSVAVRIPSHPVALALLQAAGLPIAAPSANASGSPSPTAAEHVRQDLGGKIPLILDGGPCAVGLESTVLDLTATSPTVLRPGGITPEMLRTVLPDVRVARSVLRPLREDEKALSPGMMYRHYAPKARMILVRGQPSNVRARCASLYRQACEKGETARVFAFEEHVSAYEAEGVPAVTLGSLAHLDCLAHDLFALLRQMDQEGVELLLCELPPPTGLGLALRNRLSRAASFHIQDADQPL